MGKSVYIETTVPSGYVTHRRDAHSLARRQDTREWWETQRQHYECYTSAEVLLELEAGDFPDKRKAIGLLVDLPLLRITEEVMGISEAYVRNKIMPGPIGRGDSLHVALASFYRMDFLLTWNIRHLANPNKVEHLVVVNRRLGLVTPAIVTPDMLWAEES